MEAVKCFAAVLLFMMIIMVPLVTMFGIAYLADEYSSWMMGLYIPFFVVLFKICAYVERDINP